MIKKYTLLLLCLSIIACAAKKNQTISVASQDEVSVVIDDTNIDHAVTEPDDVQIQFLQEMLTYKSLSTMGTEITIAMLAMQGASLANEHITTQGQLLSEKINRNSQTIQTSMQSFQNKAQTNQQKKLQSLMTAFSNAQQDVQAKTVQANAASNLELDYLYKNISIEKPQQNYIFNQIQFDQLFTLGTMPTPAGQVWKNPFSVGDWQFDKETNSFWQYQSSPIFNPSTDDNGNTTSSSLQSENNAIFTEYFTQAEQYTIAGSITIYAVNYPCFVGILCNKSRWISGDFASLRKSRMVGIYATSPTDIGVYYTEQYTMSDEQLKASANDDPIQTPLQQILTKKVDKKASLPSHTFDHLDTQPITFNFEIINSPTSLVFTLKHQEQDAISWTVNSLDPALYMYHGIGFISPGAVAQFKLTQPADLIFDDQALLNFKD
jgi:hypothetical protein